MAASLASAPLLQKKALPKLPRTQKFSESPLLFDVPGVGDVDQTRRLLLNRFHHGRM